MSSSKDLVVGLVQSKVICTFSVYIQTDIIYSSIKKDHNINFYLNVYKMNFIKMFT